MFNNQDFTQNRRSFIGGSDIGAILGVSRFRSPMDVWLEKTGRQMGQRDNTALRFGSFAEEFIANEYALQTGEVLINHAEGLTHPQHPFCIGHIDRFILNNQATPLFHQNGTLNTKKLLECKTASYFSQNDWGEIGTDAVPLPYLCQCLWYLGITQVPTIDLAVFIGGSDFRIYSISRDERLESILFEKAYHFWHEYVQKDIPPPAKSELDYQRLFKQSTAGKSIEANQKALRLIQELHSFEHIINTTEEKISQIRQDLMHTMQDAETMTYAGKTLISWKSPKPSVRIDTKRLSQDHPLLAKEYQVTSQTSRRFVVRDLAIPNIPPIHSIPKEVDHALP